MIVDDNISSDGQLPRALGLHGLVTTVVINVAGLDRMLRRLPTDLVILDLQSAGEALLICRRLAADAGPPVIMLNTVTSDAERAAALEAGADYLISKPFNFDALLAHVRAVLRRGRNTQLGRDTPDDRICAFLGWRFDLSAHELIDPAGDLVDLTPNQFAILRTFIEHPRRVLTRSELKEATRQRDASERAIDAQISRLRHKMRAEAIIRTVRSAGYMFIPAIERV